MPAHFDRSEFVDEDFESEAQVSGESHPATPGLQTESELEHRVSQTHGKIEELRRAQEKLEKERLGLEEARRRRHELESGHEEMLAKLTRTIGILEEEELKSRQDAEQMSKALNDLRKNLDQIKRIDWESWTDRNWSEELSKSLVAIENARSEVNTSFIKWPMLSGDREPIQGAQSGASVKTRSIADLSFKECTRIGLAFIWPILLLGLVSIILTIVYWFGT